MENAGYTITDQFERRVGDHKEGVVLGYKDKPYIGREYVTWEFTDYGERSYFWGHYTCNQEAAVKDYYDRIDRQRGF